MDTPEEQLYDDLTRLASIVCGTPISLISLVDEKRQWFKSHHGLSARETPRDLAFCAHAILEHEPFVVPNADEDERFKDNPLVTDQPKVKFYAGIPLSLGNDLSIGTLCVIDHQPKQLSKDQIEALQCIARQVVSQLSLRLKVKRLKKIEEMQNSNLRSVAHQLENSNLIERTQAAARIGS